MPHKRKKKPEFSPQLEFEPGESWLYLSIHSETEDTVSVPLPSLILLFILRYCSISVARLRLLVTSPMTGEMSVRVSRRCLPHGKEINIKTESFIAPREVRCCRPPVWYLPKQRTCIAGLCSVSRYLLRMAAQCEGLEMCKRLLGFQQGCLSAPAEVSTWTRYCEVEAITILSSLNQPSLVCLPEDLARLEAHLSQPIRMHNIRDTMHKSGYLDGKEKLVDEDPIHAFARDSHVYAEGAELLLSDILLYPVFHLINRQTDLLDTSSTPPLPNITTWFERVSQTGAGSVMDSLLDEVEGAEKLHLVEVDIPAVAQHSLYKSDPQRDSGKVFTKQMEVDRGLSWWLESGIESAQCGEGLYLPKFSWSALPSIVQPGAGSLPLSRTARKAGQLESLAAPLVDLVSDGDIVVDFCAGGGHLGLLLAHLLPQATLHMVENKEESLARARARGLAMEGTNTWFFQSNLDYYQGEFQVGCSLHACGLATDLVMAKCTEQRAAFVCCPCCYGGVTATSSLSYPRSQQFSSLPYSDYLSLGHAADQTEAGSAKLEQGRLCMDLVDTDRVLAARDCGYTVTLSKLTPQDCTPKNNLLAVE